MTRKGAMIILLCRSFRFLIFFVFSSRRRHTRLQGDWSSDVCSSDICWCDHAATAFRTWLQQKYGPGQKGLDELNEAWGTAFWGQRYPSLPSAMPSTRRLSYGTSIMSTGLYVGATTQPPRSGHGCSKSTERGGCVVAPTY